MTSGNRKRALSLVLFILSGILVCAGVALAAGTVLRTSNRFTSKVDTPEISIALLENQKEVEGEDALLKDVLGGEALMIGKIYDEELAVSNTKDTPQYVRMTVRKYWMEDEEGKRVDLSPDLIVLKLGEEGWIADTAAAEDASPERTVLYYTKPLEGGEKTTPAVTGIGLDTDVAKIIKQTAETVTEGKTITTTYKYDGLMFGLEAEVDGIQTHNAEDAAKSVWGADISVADDGTLSLK